MDLTLHIIISPATHALEGMKAASRYRKGDIIDVYKATKFAVLQPDGNYQMQSQMGQSKFAFIHVKNIPNSFDKQKIKSALLPTIKILGGLVRRRKWHIPPSVLPGVFKQKILTDREVTIEFSIVKPYIRKKTTPVILDPEQDDISTALINGDLE